MNKSIESKYRLNRTKSIIALIISLTIMTIIAVVVVLNCSRNKTRVLDGYMKLGYDEILDIYKMAYGE